MSNIKKEILIKQQPIPVDLKGTRLIVNQMENYICKIFKDNGEKGTGTGFFCKIPFPDENNQLNVLITNNHVLNENEIEVGKTIKLIMNNKGKKIEKSITIDESRKTFTKLNDKEGIDITIIEIKENKDEINNFLDYDNDEILGIEYKRKSIYILHYPNDIKLVSYGLIQNIIDGKQIRHYCNTYEGSSGSPILSLNNYKVIGVHYGGVDKEKNMSQIKLNFGTFINYAITLFNEKYKNEAYKEKNIETNENKTESINQKEVNNKQDIETNENNIELNNKNTDGIKNELKIANGSNIELNHKNENETNKNVVTNENKIESINKNQANNNKKNIEANDIKKENDNEYRNNIKLFYYTEKEDLYKIFGNKFVNNNKYKIDLIINGEKSKLVEEEYLIKGENKIELNIKSKITNLEHMFYKCSTLKNIDELKYLNTKDINNFSYMFYRCSSLFDINGLQNWDVSYANNFESMFNGCSSLLNLNKLQKWEVSNVKTFKSMFYKCSSLSDINGLKKWDVSNSNNFSSMFLGCSSLSDLNALQYWTVSNGNNFECMFYKCSLLSDITGLKDWDVSKVNSFRGMFLMCSSLLNLNALENWNISNATNFEDMFGGCIKLSDINGLKNWKVSKSNNFKGMFFECLSLSNINGLQNWDLPNTFVSKIMFNGFPSSLSLASTQN